MSAFLISGGRRLYGDINVHGAKNSILPILAASIINDSESIIHNCPELKDVDTSIKILRHLGCEVKREQKTLIINSRPMCRCDIPDVLMREMRSSVVFLGAILARAGEADMSYPGGCELGPRPIDLHLWALRMLGADIAEECGNIICKADNMRGCKINLNIPSVGATENIMLAACSGEGTTTITNAAREPEIVDLQEFLKSMGVKIEGAGGSTIIIEGRREFKKTEHSIIPDRIVACTYMSAAAAAGGEINITGVCPEHFSTVTSLFAEAGCNIEIGENNVYIARRRPLKAVRPVRTMAYPGFPTDAQAPVMAAMLMAEGTTVFVENIFENRFRHVEELARMGADVKIEGRVAVVCGVGKMYGARVESTDLRGGAALVVAALAAEGVSRISGLEHIDRGYERFEDGLLLLGADIARVSGKKKDKDDIYNFKVSGA